ncbi:hypothetical protein [Bulleidia sp. zg-1006]|uniref:hypothetical protein n=1 Tax=Bulleidia sp. zg-1006 TaxID=2806552 RepID=UPI001939ECFD|nr:hypothetical protein [Bulleidia sp. zg-1006]QRG86078.1 hypothetical protein JOS54_04175 [Bulleidia sp. zg-1006]
MSEIKKQEQVQEEKSLIKAIDDPNKPVAPFHFTVGMIKEVKNYELKNRNNIETNRRMMMAEVFIPKDNFRNLDFGYDENNINLNQRVGYVNLPASRIGLNLVGRRSDGTTYPVKTEIAENIILEKPKFPNQKFTLYNVETGKDVTNKFYIKGCYFYMLKERDVNIHFIGRKKENGEYEKIDKVTIKGDKLIRMYDEALEISKLAKENKGIRKADRIQKEEQLEAEDGSKRAKTKKESLKLSKLKEITKKEYKQKESPIPKKEKEIER